MARSRLVLLFRKCLHQRTTPDEFEKLLRYATLRGHGSHDVVTSLINATVGFCVGDDPLVSAYLQTILSFQHASVRDCMSTFIVHWQTSMRSNISDNATYTKVLAQMITDVAVLSVSVPASVIDVRVSIILSSRWLQTLFKLTANNEITHDNQHTALLVNALGVFLITNLDTSSGLEALKIVSSVRDDPLNVAVRQVIHGSMATFPDLSMRLLSGAQKHPALDDDAPVGETSNAQADQMAAMTFENNIALPPIEPTRLATYTLLLTKLSQGLTVDDAALYTFLDGRYSSDTASMFHDLLFASFDLLTKASRPQDHVFNMQCRIYLLNKLPAVLALISNNFQPLPTEQYLQELWNELQALAQEDIMSIASSFLQTCTLHHLITTEAVHNLIGTELSHNIAKGIISRQALVDQVKANASRGPRLIDELVKNDGNAGSFSQTIVDIMHWYCQARETNHLKEMATAIVKYPVAINTISLFIRPSYFLSPLCRLLDDWSWDDLHGESQPLYEEFGSVLLLLMAFKFRLNLRTYEMGLVSPDGFVAQYLSSGQAEKMLSQLSDSEKSNLGDWVYNLYESEGISDEVTSNCSAKEFYLMVPTLLRQSMTALAKGKLSQEKLEGGLDYLLEPFLLPSLLSSFAWLSQAILKDYRNAMIIVRRLVKSPENPETSKLHKSILSIAYGMFAKTTANFSDGTQSAEVNALFRDAERFSVAAPFINEELSARIEQENGLVGYLQHTLSDLVTVPGGNSYNPGLVVAAAQTRGLEAVVSSIISLLVRFASNHQFPQLLDVASTVIASTQLHGVSLRTTLQLLHAKLGNYIKNSESLFAQALVHLFRRVEMYAVALAAQTNIEAPIMGNIESVDLVDINLDQLPMETEVKQPTSAGLAQTDPMVAENIDQMLSDAENIGAIDDFGLNDNSMFGMDEYDLTNIDDLDMSMF